MEVKVFYMPLFACDENLFSNGQDSMPYMTSMEIAKKSLIQMTILRTNYNHGQKAWDTSISEAFSNSHRSSSSPHATNNVGHVYPEFFPSFNFV